MIRAVFECESSEETRMTEIFEVRLNDDRTIDEIIARDVKNFHLEQMDIGAWWIGITRSNGEVLRINLYNRRNARILCNVESDDGTICEGFE